jgi:hypothetical protein
MKVLGFIKRDDIIKRIHSNHVLASSFKNSEMKTIVEKAMESMGRVMSARSKLGNVQICNVFKDCDWIVD